MQAASITHYARNGAVNPRNLTEIAAVYTLSRTQLKADAVRLN